MLKSMTAFARAEKNIDDINAVIEIRSLNSKYLDIILKIPPSLYSYEEEIKKIISNNLSRGRIEVYIHVIDNSEEEKSYEIDFKTAQAYYNALMKIINHFKLKDEISLDQLLNSGHILKLEQIQKDSSKAWPLIKDCLNDAIDSIISMRIKEGDTIAKDFENRLLFIENQMNDIAALAKDLPCVYQNKLKEKITVLTQGVIEIDESRIAQEAAFLADKSDISEEMVRINSHIDQFRNLIYSNEQSGRKLNFLLQELSREFNTIGAKTSSIDISHIIVSLKAEQEKIREQVQNIE